MCQIGTRASLKGLLLAKFGTLWESKKKKWISMILKALSKIDEFIVY